MLTKTWLKIDVLGTQNRQAVDARFFALWRKGKSFSDIATAKSSHISRKHVE